MLQGQRDLFAVTKLILSELAPVVSAQTGVFYIMEDEDGNQDAQTEQLLRLQGAARASPTASAWERAWWASAASPRRSGSW